MCRLIFGSEKFVTVRFLLLFDATLREFFPDRQPPNCAKSIRLNSAIAEAELIKDGVLGTRKFNGIAVRQVNPDRAKTNDPGRARRHNARRDKRETANANNARDRLSGVACWAPI